MNKKLILASIVAVVIIAAGAIAYASHGDDNVAVSSPPRTETSPAAETPESTGGETITITGKMTCLSPKDQSGPTSMSCAIGLTGDDGKNYALGSDDPTKTSAPTGQQVKVTGVLTEQSTQLDVVGVIKVDTLELQ